MQRISVIDSHTGGEPTRLIIDGGPDLGGGPLADRLERFRREFDEYRSATVNEPRGSDVAVGALLCEPHDASCAAGVIFFNNVGFLGMCGHGTIGLIATLAHMGRLGPGDHRIETPVGTVTATLHADGQVTVANVPSFRTIKSLTVDVPGLGPISGDLAWGGNWFYLVERHGHELSLANVETLTDVSWRIRQAVNRAGHPELDHVELFGPPTIPGADSRSFVLCPGKADGKLAEGAPWVQESIIGSTFTGRYHRHGKDIIPSMTGTAFVNAESTLLLDVKDPFCWGIRV
jgi:4-hydroxyproline epimerase